MDQEFLGLVADSPIAVTVKDADGYCVYANHAAEAVRGFGPDGMLGKHITELAGADPILVEREFERFKRDGAWIGQYPTRQPGGELVFVRSCHFIHCESDGTPLYVSFTYPVSSRNGLGRDGPARMSQFGLTAQDVCLAQFYVDGFTDNEVATLLGVGPEGLRGHIADLLGAVQASSKTEACVRVLKSRLLV
jgi:PAS domain S-box-containing protein